MLTLGNMPTSSILLTSPSHPNFSNMNKKVIGKFKDEAMGKQVIEFVGLRPKMYSMVLDCDVLGYLITKENGAGQESCLDKAKDKQEHKGLEEQFNYKHNNTRAGLCRPLVS